MENEEQYLTEQHYLTCDNGAMPKKVSVTSQNFVKFSGTKAATINDKQLRNNFACVGKTAFAAGAVAGLACCLVPGPGWFMAAIIAAALVLAVAAGLLICQSAAATRFWDPSKVAPTAKINKVPVLILSSCMVCPSKGGTITASQTIWEAWGKQALTNLGHLANFAFGFLVGRGAGAMVAEGAAAYGSASAAGASTSTAATTGLRAFFQSFKTIAQTELKNQFNPFGGWKGGTWYCNALRGFGLFGAYKDQWDIWTDDEKSTLDKIQASGVGLILSVFAAKGMTMVCFPAGTKVHTQWGLADIEKLDVGVPILTYNETTGQKEYKPILKTTQRTTPKMCIVELSNGETLCVTPEHRFYTDGKWVAIEDFEIGDILQTKDDIYLVIENKAIITTLVEVFNLEVEGNENYYVTEDGILVHNGCEKMGRPKGNMPGNNQVQNKQVRDLVNKYRLTKDEQRTLHDYISGQGLGYHDIEQIIKEIFNK
ncbi:MAG: hypothetical protein RL662_752 [Bacteroidota bacterium]|jgi:hypothetical protein